jgi:hypothetical protein
VGDLLLPIPIRWNGKAFCKYITIVGPVPLILYAGVHHSRGSRIYLQFLVFLEFGVWSQVSSTILRVIQPPYVVSGSIICVNSIYKYMRFFSCMFLYIQLFYMWWLPVLYVGLLVVVYALNLSAILLLYVFYNTCVIIWFYHTKPNGSTGWDMTYLVAYIGLNTWWWPDRGRNMSCSWRIEN